MNLRKFLLVLLTCVTLFHFSAFAQRDSIPLTTIIAKTSKLNNDHPNEKVYVHFDKPYYAVSDTIWFKGYVTIDLHQPSNLSKILYLEMTNIQGQILSESKLRLVNGMASGYIPLPSAYFSRGNYRVRAYTRWMRNADPAYFFNRTISLGTTEQGQVFPRVSFKNVITEKNAKINAVVVYKDQDGNPYSNKKVAWKASNDDGTINKGKGETDKDGVLHIEFSSEKPSELNASTISTDLAVEEKNIVTKSFPIELTSAGIDVQFFPEGGHLINGVRSRVAFKVVKPDGLGIDATGTIVDNAGTLVANFSTQHLGMGVFAMMPENDKTYKANLTFADGTQSTIDLPTARLEGISISVVNNAADSLYIRITSSDSYFQKNQDKTFYVVGQSGGVVCYAAQTVLKTTSYSATIPKSKFPTGILQVSVFSSKGTPLSERITFINNHDQLNLSLKSDQAAYSRRQKVRMLVSAKNKSLPSEGNFSVSVVNESVLPWDDNNSPTILSQLLLTSDLRGFVEQPNYYFNNTDEKKSTDLDVLMMTQGYRRFSYKNVLADKIPPISFLPEQGIEISGTLRTNTGMPVSRGNVRLFIPDKAYSTTTVTDMNGNYRFSNVMVSDSSKVTVNARDNANGSSLVLSVDGMIPPPQTQFINPAGTVANLDSTLRPFLQNTRKQSNTPRALKEVVIKTASAVKKPSHSDYGSLNLLKMDPDHTIAGAKFKDCNTFASCLTAESLGLTFDGNNLYVTRDYNAGGRTPVAIFVNGMNVDFNYLMNVDPNMVESVEIFNDDGFSSINRTTGTKGVIEVNVKKQTKGEKISKDQLLEMLSHKYIIEFAPGGYNTDRVFYTPKYTAESNSSTVDLRSTIYWNPEVVTDKAGNASFEFYNSDGTGTYKAIIEGIDRDGNIGRYVYRYKVQ